MSMDGGASQPAGWYPDPHGRSEQRWFDGTNWTTHVANGGQQADEAASPAAASGAMLYGNLGHLPPSRAVRPPRREINAIGPGFFLGLVGIVVVAASTLLPWVGDVTLFDLGDQASGAAGSTSPSSALQVQAIVSILWLLVVVLVTTTRTQPGPGLGFLVFGCIGLLVCWSRVDRDDRTARANVLGVIAVILHGLSLYVRYVDVVDDTSTTSTGSGPVVLGVGLLLVLVGVLVGRRRRLVELPYGPGSGYGSGYGYP